MTHESLEQAAHAIRDGATTAQLIEIVSPFVGARLNLRRNPASPNGAYLPRTSGVTILHDSSSVDADVRRVTSQGVSIHFDGRDEFVPWSKVRSVSVFARDEWGGRSCERTWRHDALMAAVAGDDERRAAA